MTSDEIRQQFIDFFTRKHGHVFVPSSPVVPLDDPTLLFTNAGMNQFKPLFLGTEKREYTRAVNTQKCIRAGGKHNDLDDVGRSRRHHTFFEMLGNWSFGDYFKRGAISMSWELLTAVFKMDPERIHVTCYEGDEKAGIPRDTEAAELWKEIAGLPDDHIHFLGKENFWEMGDTGPCGPCTEIFFDRTPGKTGGPSVVKDDDPRVMEFWNNVFIQYNRDAAGKLTTLPAQHVDTGMGFERICQILQDKPDNYATDLWTPLFDKIAEISGLKYEGKFPETNAADPVAEAADEQLRHDIAFRVVADHVRCLTFALTDGAVPSNEGRGYVLRRILRRAVRFGRQQLELNDAFLHTLVPTIVNSMGGAFPELKANPQRVIDLIREEEASFGKTLDRGIALFADAAQMGSIKANDAFKLHDTYGFPIDLTRIMAEERGLSVDVAGYEKLMEKARDLARLGGSKSGPNPLFTLNPSGLAALAASNVAPTNDRAKFDHEPISAAIRAIWNGSDLGLSPASATEDEELAIILDRTNFYAEMGGQIGDRGTLTAPTSLDLGEVKNAAASVFDVETTRIVGGFVLHVGRVRSGKLKVGEIVTAAVDLRDGQRIDTEKNHTAAHLANWALRQTLGEDVQQKGSLVDAEKMRFDFSHGKALTDDELERVEKLVTERIANRLPVYTAEVPQEQALEINGLRAVFGEKYPPMVRVVSIGKSVPELLADPSNPEWRNHSVEFCGGTHLQTTGEATQFALIGEESVSKGIRRIVGVTGNAAVMATAAGEGLLAAIAGAQKASPESLATIIPELQERLSKQTVPLRIKRRAQAAIVELQQAQKLFEKSKAGRGSSIDIDSLAHDLQKRGDVIVAEVAGATDEQLRNIMNTIHRQRPRAAMLLASSDGVKVSFVAMVSDQLIADGLRAGDWVKEAAKVAGGGGGGRPQMAQAGGKDPSKISEALSAAKKFAEKTLSVSPATK